MTSIDERIVEMRFENEQFEKNIKESQLSLEKLKSSLRMEESVNAVSDSLNKISDRFSIVGIAVDQLTRNLTNSFYSMATNLKNTVMDLSFNQIGVGFDKYEKKLQSVQTIMNATGKSIEEVNVSLDKLNWFTDETSYDFTSMVDNIAKFTSNQIPLETAVTSMIGIADAAGLAGASVADASHAMDGFSKAMGQGYMTARNWNWIKTAHMDTAKFKEILIESGLATKTLKKNAKGIITTLEGTEVSIANFEEGMKDGWMSVKVMNKALKQFGGTTEEIYKEYLKGEKLTSEIIADMGDMGDDLGLKAFRAAQEAKTFTDAINSVKDAVSTGWMTSFEYIFGNYDEAKVMWTDLANEMWEVFNGGAEDRNELLRSWHFDLKGYESMLRSIGNIWEGIKAAMLPITTAFRDFFPKTTVDQLKTITESFEAFSVKFRDFFSKVGNNIWPFKEEVEDVVETVEGATGAVADSAKKVVDAVETIEGPVAKTKKVLDELAYAVWRGDYGNGETRVKKLRELGYSYELVQNRVNELIEAYYGLPKGYYIRRKVVEDDAKTSEKEAKVEKEVTEVLEDQIEVIKKYVNETPRKTSIIWNMYQAFTGLFSAAKLVVDVFKAIAKGMSPLLKIGVQIFQIFGAIGSIIGQITTKIVDYIRETGILEKITDRLQRVFNKLSDALQPVVDWFEKTALLTKGYINLLKHFVKQVLELDSVKTTIGYFKELGQTIKNVVTENFQKFVGLAKDFVKIKFKLPTMEDMLELVDNIAKGFNSFIEYLKGQNPVESIEGWWGSLVTGAGGIWQTLLNTIQDPNSIFGKAYEAAKQFGLGLVEGLDSLNLDTILSILSTGSLAYFLYSFATAARNLAKVFKSVDVGQFDQLMTSVRTVLNSFSKNLKAEAFIKMAKAIGILALSLIGLGQLSKEQIASVTVSIVGIILALKLLMDAMTAMNYSRAASSVSGLKGLLEGMKWALSNAFMWQSFGFMLVGIATALVIFVKALSGLVTLVNESFGEDIKDAFWILTAMLIGFTAFVGLIFKLTKGMNAANKLGFGKIFSSLGVALLFAALAIKIAVPALKDLAEAIHLTAGGDILGVALIISVLGAALAGLSYVLGKTDKSPGAKLLMLAAGFMAIVYAMKYVTPLLQDFWHWLMDFIHENKNLEYIAELFKKWWWVLIPMAIALAAVTAALFVLQNVLQPLGMLLIGIGIAAAGIGLGIRLAGDSMEAFAKGLVAAFKVINDNKELVIGAVAAIVSGILAAVTKNKAKLIWTVVAVLGGIVEAINIVGPDVIETLGNQIQLAIEYVVSLLAEIVDVFVYMAIQVINALADAIDNNRDPILDAISRLLTALRDLVAGAVKRVFPWLSDWLANFVSSIGLVVAASFPVVKAIGSITKAFGGLKATLSTVFIKSPKNVFSFLKEGLFGVMGATPGDSSLGLIGTLHNVLSGGAFGTAAYSGFKDLFKDLGKKGTMIGIAAVVAGMYGIGKALQNITDKEHEAIKAQHELTNSHKNYISKMNDSYEEFTQQNNDLQSSIKNVVDEYDGYSALVEEYDKLLDSNGKVIEGNEKTADTILNKLSKALGIEKEDLQNLITEHGNLQSAIGETIKMKEAEALIGSMQEDYVEALSKRTQRQREETLGRVLLSSSEKELEEETKKLDTYFAKMQEAQEKGDKNAYTYWNKLYTDQSVAVAKVNANVQELTVAHDQALEMLNENERNITNYENVRDAYISGEITSINEAIELTTQGLPEALKTAKNSTQKELSEQLGALINGYNQLKTEADNGNQEVTNTMLTGGKSLIVDARNELLKSFGLFDETGKFCGEAYTDAVKEQLMSLSPEAVNYIETFLKPALDADTSEQGANTASTYTEGMITAITSNNAIEDQVAAIKDLFNIDTNTIGVDDADSYISGIVDSLGTGEISIDMAINSIMDKFGATEQAEENAEETVQTYVNTIEDNSSEVEAAVVDVTDNAMDKAAEVAAEGGEKTGEQSVNGIVRGLYKFADRVEIAASYVASKIPKASGQTLEIRSPSRVAMRLGKFWDLGLARGIADNSFTVLDSSSDVSNSIIESMKNAVQAAYAYINSTDEINPRITPVLDLSEIQNGTGLINGMFGNTSLSLASANGVRFEANRVEALNRLETASTNADVVAALGLLRGDINNLNDSFANTQVVLDSGALVGATAKQMDNALGRFKTYKGRGI